MNPYDNPPGHAPGKCNTCGKTLDETVLGAGDCGGDCDACMITFGDPDVGLRYLKLAQKQHALLEQARGSLHLCYDHCRLYHPEVEGNNVGADTRATLAALNQHLDQK